MLLLLMLLLALLIVSASFALLECHLGALGALFP